MGILGLSFGSKKQKGSQTADTTKDVTLDGSQTTNSTTSGTTNVTGTKTGVIDTVEQQLGTSTKSDSSIGKQSSSTTGTSQSLGTDVIDALGATTKSLLGGGVTEEGIAALSDAITARPSSFDGDAYVSGTVAAARNRAEQQLQEGLSKLGTNIGGTAGTNSMVSLLANRGRNDLEATLAGIEAQAQATAAGINNQNLSTASEAQARLAGSAADVANAAKGGVTTTDQTTLMDQINQLLSQGSTTQNNTGSQNSTQNENTTTNQLLQQISDVLTKQKESTVATEDTTFKGKSGGFGISVGI